MTLSVEPKPERRLVDMSWDPVTRIIGNLGIYTKIDFAQNQALEQAGWPGTTEYWRGNPRYLEFQQRDWGNLQKAVLDPRVRKAVLHGIDRKGLVDGIYAGRAPIVHFWLDRSDPAFPAVDAAVTKYEFDLARSAALLQEAGWTRGTDGMMHNAAGELLTLE